MSISAIRATSATPHPMRRAGDFVIERETVADAKADSAGPVSGALTPTEPVLHKDPVSSRAGRPDASFIAHLIATAEQAPQTRALRRAAVADAEAAYRATSSYAAATATARTRLTA